MNVAGRFVRTMIVLFVYRLVFEIYAGYIQTNSFRVVIHLLTSD